MKKNLDFLFDGTYVIFPLERFVYRGDPIAIQDSD